MKYEETGKKVNKDTAKNAKDRALKTVSTNMLVWHLIKRHRFGLMTVYALGVTIYLIFPAITNL